MQFISMPSVSSPTLDARLKNRPISLVLLWICLGLATNLAAQEPPGSGRDLASVRQIVLPDVDLAEIRRADEQRVSRGAVPHYAVPLPVSITPWSHGRWDATSPDTIRWRLRLTSRGALSLNLGFARYRMPEGGKLTISAIDGSSRIGPFSEEDNESHGQLWTPPMLSDDLLLEVTLPFDSFDDLELKLVNVFHGYAGFGEPEPKAGRCHLDISCSEAMSWEDQARSVGLVSVDGVRFCTGFLVNNTALDGRPLFMTANHCGIQSANAPSVVVIWNHQSATCRSRTSTFGEPRSDLHFQTGAKFLAAFQPTDTVLLELDDQPDPAFNVFYAGWDRSPEAPTSSVVIHHPNTDAKRISFDFDASLPTAHLADRYQLGGTHLRVASWNLGSTEGGSSGAPLFNRDKRVVGQLHGGYAACGNRKADWFGRLANAWDGWGRPNSRLRDWLDPVGSQTLILDGLDGASVEAR